LENGSAQVAAVGKSVLELFLQRRVQWAVAYVVGDFLDQPLKCLDPFHRCVLLVFQRGRCVPLYMGIGIMSPPAN
jgi:hypothetical protein